MNWFIFLFKLPLLLESIMTTIVELKDSLVAIQSQLSKAREEIINKIDDLQIALTNVPIPPEAEEALANLVATAQGLDDIVPDPTPE